MPPKLDRSAQQTDQTLFDWLKYKPARKRTLDVEGECNHEGGSEPPSPKRTRDAAPEETQPVILDSMDDAIFDDDDDGS